MLSVMPDLEIGIVMDDIRYTNFDVSRYWATQTWQYTDFRDVPHGIADKIIIFPRAEQTNLLHELIPDDFTVHVSEGRLWMLMAPHANKRMRCKHYATSGGWMHNRPRHSAMTWSISA